MVSFIYNLGIISKTLTIRNIDNGSIYFHFGPPPYLARYVGKDQHIWWGCSKRLRDKAREDREAQHIC